ncbi:relA-associated inhibitor isoform X2 [Rhinatrema bivittatum]|uniref:relA-associated inhibitor isoform X2 n=1 Tax=Rhinatrema bivittatum TaxID=194408 RepID=UPI00112B3D38|nr:relA-associated inhibitor isoform X2 [Rhinatrema bivittatum]
MVRNIKAHGKPKLSRFGSVTSLVMPENVQNKVRQWKGWYKLLGWRSSAAAALDRNLKKMSGQQMQGSQSLVDLSFQSLAMKNIDLKQMELDTAVAKVDELSKQLESMWSESSPTSLNAPAIGQNKNNKYEAGPSMSQDQLVIGTTSFSSPALSPSMSSRKVLAPEVNDNYLPAPSRTGPTPASYSVPALVFNPPLNQSNTLSTVSHKNSLARSSSPRPMYYLPDQKPLVDRPQSPRPIGVPSSYDMMPYLSQPGRASSPQPMQLKPAAPLDHLSPLRPMMGGQHDYVAYAGQPIRAASPRPMGTSPEIPMSPAFFPDRVPSPRLPPAQGYEIPSVYTSAVNAGSSAFTPLRSSDDLAATRRRPQKNWNESDLDVAYEKKPSQHSSYDRGDAVVGFRPGMTMGSWRESSVDIAPTHGKDDPLALTNATLPKNYKFTTHSSERRADPGFWRAPPGGHTSTLPRNWQASQQPISRIPIPPPSPQGARPKPQKPIPLSMIFKLQNAFWEHRAPSTVGKGQPQSQTPVPAPQAPGPVRSLSVPESNGKSPSPDGSEGAQDPFKGPHSPTEMGEIEPELETLIPASDPTQVEEVPRPLSPTRLQPLLPPEAQKVPELEEIRRVLEDIPRPLKRRGSMEQTTSVPLPTHKKQYQLIMSKLFRRHSPKETVTLVGEAVTVPQPELPIIIEGSEAKVGASLSQEPLVTPTPVNTSPEKRSVLKKGSSPQKAHSRRARLNPLVLLLDAALTGELDVVQQAVSEMNDPSLANDEGITALHNAICGANYDIVDFLINIGVNVNAPDSHGWTPLHCAASCNDTSICVSLLKHGAAIYATTFSDGTTAIEKCDPYREGYKECYSYLADVEQSMGLLNSGVVYALWSYSAEFSDELSFHESDPVTILRRDDQEETEWWWASLYGQEGYVPKNYFGLFPRVRVQRNPV